MHFEDLTLCLEGYEVVETIDHLIVGCDICLRFFELKF
jgi:hypothetical protein